MLSGAGVHTFGKASPGKIVIFSNASLFPIKNASSSKLTLANGFTFSGTSGTLAFTITGSGAIEVTELINRGSQNLAVTVNSSGSGAVRLLAANQQNLGTTISAGTVEIGNASALGTGTVTMTGGKLSSSSTTGYVVGNPLVFNGTVTLGDSTNTGAVSTTGTATFNGGTTTVLMDGGAQGLFRGTTTINSATLVVNNYNLFGYHSNASAPSVTISTGGTFTNNTNGLLTTIGPLTMAGGTLTSGAAQNVGFWAGAYILRGGVTATENSTISGFPIAVGSDTSPTGTINVASGKTLTISTQLDNTPNTAFSALQTTNLTKQTGTGTLTLTGANTFTGTVSVSAGTLNTNSATALGSTSGGAISVTSGATLSLGAAPTYTSRSLTIGGTGTASTVGALVIANSNANTNQFQSITLGSPTNYIRATSSGISEINAPFTTNNNSIILGATSGVYFRPFSSNIFSQVFSGTGSVTYGSHSLDTGDVETGGEHDYIGNTTLAFGTTYVPSSREIPGTSGPFGKTGTAGSLLMTGGILFYSNGNYDYSGRFSIAGSQQWRINTGSSSVAFSSSLQGNSLLSLLGGDLSLSGNSSFSSFTGGVNLVGGTLTLDAPVTYVGLTPTFSPIGVSGTITFTGGTLRYTSFNSFDYSARFSTNAGQSFKIDTNSQNVIFASALTSLGGSLVKLSLGTLTLSVANTYNSGTTLSYGTIKCGNVTSLGTGGLVQAGGTTLQVATANGKLTIQGAHTSASTGNRFIRIGA